MQRIRSEFGVNVSFQADLAAVGGKGLVREIEIATAGDLVGKELAAFEAKLAILQALVKNFVGVLLDGELGILEEREVLHFAGIFEIDEDGDAFTAFGLENGGEQALEAERREGFFGGVQDTP